MIYHIYWGTSGNSGLYLDEIYQVLKNRGYKQRVFVNFYYPFDYGEKIFFKRGDVAMSKYKGKVRKFFQLLEILMGFVKIIIVSKRDKPTIINYSHVGQSYFFIVWFLDILKRVSSAKLMVTCHDVNPHKEGKYELLNRNKIFYTADYLLVHTEKSVEDLEINFGISQDKIIFHPFPIMDLTKMKNDSLNPYKETDFLFIGHLRKDKGIEFLLETWKDFHQINRDAKLRICGRYLPDVHFNQKELEKCNVEFNLRYIDDNDYYHYIKAARYVILPYIHGTNSGIISTVLSVGTNVITSDLPMFTQNPLVGTGNTFIVGNKKSLIDMLQKKWVQKTNPNKNTLLNYKKEFENEVCKVYDKIFSTSLKR